MIYILLSMQYGENKNQSRLIDNDVIATHTHQVSHYTIGIL